MKRNERDEKCSEGKIRILIEFIKLNKNATTFSITFAYIRKKKISFFSDESFSLFRYC